MSLRVVLIGAANFSAAMLETLHGRSSGLVGVLTRPSGDMGDRVSLVPAAKKAGISCLETSSIHTAEAKAWLHEISPDLVLCLGWSELLPESFIESVQYGVVGYHPAPLPVGRGRHPIIWALVMGLSSTASTFFEINSGIDSGPIMSQTEVVILADDTSTTLYSRLVSVARRQVVHLLEDIESGKVNREPQDERHAIYWRKRTERDSEVMWYASTRTICDLVRAMQDPYPLARFHVGQQQFEVLSASPADPTDVRINPGQVLSVRDNEVLIKTGDGAVLVRTTESLDALQVGDFL